MDDIRECYRILDLEPGASFEEIKRSYRELVRVWHPDRFGNDTKLRAKAEEKLKRINLAYERLCKEAQEAGTSPAPERPSAETSASRDNQEAKTTADAGAGAPPAASSEKQTGRRTLRRAGIGVAVLALILAIWAAVSGKRSENAIQAKTPTIAESEVKAKEEDKRSFERLRSRAETGDAEAQFDLGFMYADGQGVLQDYAKAFEWWQRAAAQGHADAPSALGTMYENGIGVPKDEARAFNYYRKAAEQGHALAQSKLGRSYEFGSGTLKDEAKAFEWYQKAAMQGNALAQLNLGRMYADRRAVAIAGDPKDPEDSYQRGSLRAYAWLNLAASTNVDGAAKLRDEIGERLGTGGKLKAQKLSVKLAEEIRLAKEKPPVQRHGLKLPSAGNTLPPASEPPPDESKRNGANSTPADIKNSEPDDAKATPQKSIYGSDGKINLMATMPSATTFKVAPAQVQVKINANAQTFLEAKTEASQQSQRLATAKYPDLKIEGSAFHTKFMELHNAALKDVSVRLDESNWPMVLAEQTAQILAENWRVAMRGRMGKQSNMKAKSEQAVIKGLNWLQQNQNPDGSWGDGNKGAMTGLGLLCFLGHGETPQSQQYGLAVNKAVEWIIDNGTNNEGRLHMASSFNPLGVYAHGICTYALGEYYTMTKDERVVVILKQAVGYIVQGQGPGGGWMYSYDKTADDLTVSGWQIQALKAARLNKLDIYGVESALDKAIAYIERVKGPNGGYGCRAPDDCYSVTGIGIFCQLLWKGERGVLRKGMEWVLEETEKNKPVKYRSEHADLYAWYYHTQACLMFGGSAWAKWNRWFQDELCDVQNFDGSWPVPGGSSYQGAYVSGAWDTVISSTKAGGIHRTALCILMLEVFYRYLPTTQG